METLLFYDLETFGTNAHYDRIAQFAAIRTDLDFNEIESPIVLYNKMTPDYLPNPDSCRVTHITPQFVNRHGIIEEEFIKRIRDEMMRNDTITLGYNTIAFDDEFIRSALYRNLYDPYEREYRNGCSRYDIIDLVRAVKDLRPKGFNFSIKNKESGYTSFQLTDLTAENNIAHESAHDALSDVRATIALAKLIKEKNEDMWNFAIKNRKKGEVNRLIDTSEHTPLLYTSTKFVSERGNTHPIMPLFYNKNRVNEVFAFDLLRDIPLDPDIYDYDSSGIIRIHVNKAPFISPLSVLDKESEIRLGFTKRGITNKCKKAKNSFDLNDLIEKSNKRSQETNENMDPDLSIYSGFIQDDDKKALEKIRNLEPKDKLNTKEFLFKDTKYHTLLWRQVCRNHPKELSKEDLMKWKNFCANRLLVALTDDAYTIDRFMRRTEELLTSLDTNGEEKRVFLELKKYGELLRERVLS